MRSQPQMMSFTESNIQKLFGHEAAEDEDPMRLREYYFKGSAYEQIVNDSPVRVLVGHKGIGKSALIKVAIAEEQESRRAGEGCLCCTYPAKRYY